MIVIRDRFQDYMQDKFETNSLVMLNELLFYGIFVYYYYFGMIQDSQQNITIFKYIGIIFVIRYLLNYITNMTIVNESKEEMSYFQFNSKIAIFTILVLLLAHNEHFITSLIAILGYALLSSSAKYGYTVDNLTTVMIVYFIFSLKLL